MRSGYQPPSSARSATAIWSTGPELLKHALRLFLHRHRHEHAGFIVWRSSTSPEKQ